MDLHSSKMSISRSPKKTKKLFQKNQKNMETKRMQQLNKICDPVLNLKSEFIFYFALKIFLGQLEKVEWDL